MLHEESSQSIKNEMTFKYSRARGKEKNERSLQDIRPSITSNQPSFRQVGTATIETSAESPKLLQFVKYLKGWSHSGFASNCQQHRGGRKQRPFTHTVN